MIFPFDIFIVKFCIDAFAYYAPNVYTSYYDHLDELYRHESGKGLRPIFGNESIFPAATFNIGPVTSTTEHRDFKNVPFGWCAITALGTFDYKRGGHLILFDINRFIEFPAGSTILIPSSLYRHGNTAVMDEGPDVYRASLTQYCAGGLFRWNHYGFKTVASSGFKAVPMTPQNLFSTQGSLFGDRTRAFAPIS